MTNAQSILAATFLPSAHALQIALRIGTMRRCETVDISNCEVDAPIDATAEDREVVVEDGEMCGRLSIIVRRRNDLMEVGLWLKATECIHRPASIRFPRCDPLFIDSDLAGAR
jgi:hypothetical protein